MLLLLLVASMQCQECACDVDVTTTKLLLLLLVLRRLRDEELQNNLLCYCCAFLLQVQGSSVSQISVSARMEHSRPRQCDGMEDGMNARLAAIRVVSQSGR